MIGIADTLKFMMAAHDGQKDKAGQPYYLHPYRVSMRLREPSIHQLHMALLHDVVEDTDFTLEQLARIGYAPEVLHGVDILTRRPGMSRKEYIRRVAGCGLPEVIMVKLADIADNSSPSRIAQLPASEQGLAKEYEVNRVYLEQALPSRFHEKLWAYVVSGDL